MVRERRTTRSLRAKPSAKKAGSVWDTPHLRKILSEPVGAPMKLSKAEAKAIIREHLANPPRFDEKKWRRVDREMKKIRRMWGSIAGDV